MNKRTLLVNGIAIGVVTLGVGSYSAFAAQNHAEIRAAIEADDYQTFTELTAESRFGTPDEATFDILVEAAALRAAGDEDGARALLEENDVRPPRAHRGERRANPEARAAIEAGDYSAWAEAMADHPNADTFVTQATFDALVEAHVLREEGDKEGAKAALEAAGIIGPEHEGMRERGNHEDHPQHEEARAAIEAGDYEAFAAVHAEHENAPEVTEDQFNLIVEAHVLREAGDHEEAKGLLEDAGIMLRGRGHGHVR